MLPRLHHTRLGTVPMVEDSSAFVIPLHQVPAKRKKAAAPRKVNRQRRQKAKAPAAEVEPPSHELLIPPEFLPANDRTADAAEPLRPAVRQVAPDASLRRKLASIFLVIAALALAAVGITINGWFARSLGASDAAGWQSGRASCRERGQTTGG